jgi:hypothetical protein
MIEDRLIARTKLMAAVSEESEPSGVLSPSVGCGEGGRGLSSLVASFGPLEAEVDAMSHRDVGLAVALASSSRGSRDG